MKSLGCHTRWGRAVRSYFVRSVLCQRRDQSMGNIHWHLLLEHLSAKGSSSPKTPKKGAPQDFLGGSDGPFFAGSNKEIPKILGPHTNMEGTKSLVVWWCSFSIGMILRFQLLVCWKFFSVGKKHICLFSSWRTKCPKNCCFPTKWQKLLCKVDDRRLWPTLSETILCLENKGRAPKGNLGPSNHWFSGGS